jgi:hypothetical protein
MKARIVVKKLSRGGRRELAIRGKEPSGRKREEWLGANPPPDLRQERY